MASYYKNALIRVSGQFTNNSSGVAVDPSTVTLKVKNPAGSTTTYLYGTDVALVKDSTGNYHVDVSATSTGTWYWEWTSTGTNQGAGEGSFDIVSPGGF